MSILYLNYYVLGDDTDFCFPISVLSDCHIIELAQMIQKLYLEYMGVKPTFPKLYRIDESQDEMVGIAAPTSRCMRFGRRLKDYWNGEAIDPDRVHILVIAGRK
jgi:hypothetical protein